jgi:hypothetical protein
MAKKGAQSKTRVWHGLAAKLIIVAVLVVYVATTAHTLGGFGADTADAERLRSALRTAPSKSVGLAFGPRATSTMATSTAAGMTSKWLEELPRPSPLPLPLPPLQPQTQDLSLPSEIGPRLERIKAMCGPLCTIDSHQALEAVTWHNNNQKNNNSNSSSSNTLLPQVRVPINCHAIMESEDIDAADTSVPYPLPTQLRRMFSLNGAIRIRNWNRFVNIYLGGTEHQKRTNQWDPELLAKVMGEIQMGTHEGTYGISETTRIRDHLRITGKIQGSRVLVIGSERPWLEAICLLLGATNVVTLEYGTILSTHPNIQTLTPVEFRKQYSNGTLGQFDTVVSFSSLEHSGLGRYGDAVNPWGDLLAVARAWCVTKPGGALALGLPTGIDYVSWNAHRVYGKVRWPLVTANWIQVDSALHKPSDLEIDDFQAHYQALMVFEKMDELKAE